MQDLRNKHEIFNVQLKVNECELILFWWRLINVNEFWWMLMLFDGFLMKADKCLMDFDECLCIFGLKWFLSRILLVYKVKLCEKRKFWGKVWWWWGWKGWKYRSTRWGISCLISVFKSSIKCGQKNWMIMEITTNFWKLSTSFVGASCAPWGFILSKNGNGIIVMNGKLNYSEICSNLQ